MSEVNVCLKCLSSFIHFYVLSPFLPKPIYTIYIYTYIYYIHYIKPYNTIYNIYHIYYRYTIDIFHLPNPRLV